MNTQPIKGVIMRIRDLACEVSNRVTKAFLMFIREGVFASGKMSESNVLSPENGTVGTFVSDYVCPEGMQAQDDLPEFFCAPSVLKELRGLVSAHGKSIYDTPLAGLSQVRLHSAQCLEDTKYKIIPVSRFRKNPFSIEGLRGA